MPKDKHTEHPDRKEGDASGNTFSERMQLDDAVPVFETPKFAVNYIQNRLVEMKAASPEEAASKFYDSLSEADRRGLFEALLIKVRHLQKEACRRL